jgi:glycosyltransferase involved in cell wall biosynthesis
VDLTGPVPRRDVPAYIDAMDICVLPDSNLYGSPMVLFEFMASGKAVIAPDLPPIRDVVTNGENGLIIRPGDAQALADALRTLLRDSALRSRLGANARTYVLAHRTLKANADTILRVGVNLLPQEVAA